MKCEIRGGGKQMNRIKRPDKDKPRVYISGKILGDKHYRRIERS